MPLITRKLSPTLARALLLAAVAGLPWPVALADDAAGGKPVKTNNGFGSYFRLGQKDTYLNASQDRVIKKGKFKAADLPLGTVPNNRELGFFAIVPQEKLSDLEFCDKLLSQDKVNGLSAAFPWIMLQPAEDSDNWRPVDDLLHLCNKHGKTLILRVTTGGSGIQQASTKGEASDTPDWVYAGGVKALSYRNAAGVPCRMPILWDKTYLAKWSNFVGDLADRYDKNPDMQSIGITGGGFSTGAGVVPEPGTPASDQGGKGNLQEVLKDQYGMTQRQLVEHWKYVADIFPKRFAHARLNFNINPPIKSRMGEDALDEIADYLVYRYGQRVYLTREGFNSDKHGFNDYRLLIKFHNDTLTGIRLPADTQVAQMAKIAKHALDDGISFAELPAALLDSQAQGVQAALSDLSAHMGYKLICRSASVPAQIGSGQPLQASFSFVNQGAAPAMRPDRNLEKDTPASFRIAIELRNAQGQPVLRNLHTPPTPTSQWVTAKPVDWDESLKLADAQKHQLPAGEYTVWMAVYDPATQRNISFLQATSQGKPIVSDLAPIGKLTISDAVAATAGSTHEGSEAPGKGQ